MTNSDYLPEMSPDHLEHTLAVIERCLVSECNVDGDPVPAWMLEEWGKIAAEINRKLAR